MVKFALPVHERFAVKATSVAFVVLEKIAVEALTREVERAEGPGIADVIILVRTGSRTLEFDNTTVFRRLAETLGC